MRVYKFLTAMWAKEAISSRRLKISLLNALNDPWDGRGVSFSSEDHKAAWNRTLSQLSQNRGMICFSTGWQDPVMWSHYADQHRGIALGFDVDDTFSIAVDYQDQLVNFDDFFATPDQDKEKFTLGIFARKHSHWKYENEVRLFVTLKDPDIQAGHFFADFKGELTLKEAIFGARYQNSEEMALVLALVRKLDGVECRKAALGNDTFDVQVDPNWRYYNPS